MGTENHSKPAFARFRVEHLPRRGYFVTNPTGLRVSSFYSNEDSALTTRDGLQRAWDAKHGRRARPCLCCHKTFESEGIHNRLCTGCRARNDGGNMSIAATSSGKVRRAAKA